MDVVETLCELVAIPSVNPMGRPLSGPEFFEHRLTEYLDKFFARLGLPSERQSIEPLRDNIVARLDGTLSPASGGKVLMLEAHQDTVPVDGMTIPPWNPEIKNNRVYGRGSCDIKGGMAAMLTAIERLAKERPQGMPTIIMACSVNEEHGYSGASQLHKLWQPGQGKVIPRIPDGAIVAEPTNLKVVVAHKAACRWRCHTRGRACHSSTPELGDNAVYKMGPVLRAFQAYAEEFIPTLPSHPLCGQATLSVGTIRGGLSVNTVPDECTIEIDRRVLPGEDSLAAYHQVIEFVTRHLKDQVEVIHDEPFMRGDSLSHGPNRELANRLESCAREFCGVSGQIGVPFGTDASRLSVSGVPSVVFGPGSIDQAHTCDEWLCIDELRKASEVIYQFCKSGG